MVYGTPLGDIHLCAELVGDYIPGKFSYNFNKTKQKIDDDIPHPISWVSWQWLCSVAIRGDFKGRQSTNMQSNAIKTREKLGITLEEAIKLYS